MNPHHYSLEITWDTEDQIYIVNVPELPGCRTHGKNYEEAIRNASDIIDLWIEAAEKDGLPVPPPRTYSDTAA